MTKVSWGSKWGALVLAGKDFTYSQANGKANISGYTRAGGEVGIPAVTLSPG